MIFKTNAAQLAIFIMREMSDLQTSKELLEGNLGSSFKHFRQMQWLCSFSITI